MVDTLIQLEDWIVANRDPRTFRDTEQQGTRGMKPIVITEANDAPMLTKAQEAELDRRLDAYRRDPTVGSPWPIVKARVLKQAHDATDRPA